LKRKNLTFKMILIYKINDYEAAAVLFSAINLLMLTLPNRKPPAILPWQEWRW
jgi:hypothetical protein